MRGRGADSRHCRRLRSFDLPSCLGLQFGHYVTHGRWPFEPETHRRVAERASEVGAGYLDGPVSGGTTGARDATLTIMIGGSAETLERATPVLKAMGQRIYHCGPVGAGAAVKLINQMMGAINNLGVFEGLVLGAKYGIDPHLLYEVCSNSSGASRALGAVPSVLKRDFEPG